MNRILLERAFSGYLETKLHGFKIIKSVIFDRFLSPVRNQGQVGACAFVASLTCIEMMTKMTKFTFPHCPENYFLDIDDVYDNVYKVFPDMNKLEDVRGDNGFFVGDVLEYMKYYGAPLTSHPKDPRPRNLFACYCKKLYRYQITSYFQLMKNEAFYLRNIYPLIMNMEVYDSFYTCKEIIYNGPYQADSFQGRHSVVVVGTITIKRNNEVREYFIVQNSWGDDFGFEGFFLLPIDNHIILDFWVPAVTPIIHQHLLSVTSCRFNLQKQHAGEANCSEIQLDEATTCERFSKIVGSPCYMAPEVLKQNYVANIFFVVETDKDGLVSYDEFGATMKTRMDWRRASGHCSGGRFNSLSKVDKDDPLQMQDGLVSYNEFLATMKTGMDWRSASRHSSGGRFNSLSKVDEDDPHQMQDGLVSYNEFLATMKTGMDWRRASRHSSRGRFNSLSKVVEDGSFKLR